MVQLMSGGLLDMFKVTREEMMELRSAVEEHQLGHEWQKVVRGIDAAMSRL